MNNKECSTGMTAAEAKVFDRAASVLLCRVQPVLGGQPVQVVTSVVVAIIARIALMTLDPDAFCLTVARDAIAIVHAADLPIGKPH